MNKISFGYIWVAVAAIVVTLGLLVVYWRSLPPEVPLWYSRPWGQEQLASPYWLWLVPILILSVTGITTLGSRYIRHDILLLNLWTTGGIVVQLILALALVRIVWLVIF